MTVKSRYMRLLEPAVIIPADEGWGSQVLGTGSIVACVPEQKPSPITGKLNEPYVRWMDAAFKEHFGWLAERTRMKRAASEQVARSAFHRKQGLTAWDHIRAKVHGIPMDARRVLTPAVREWLLRNEEDYRAEMIAVVREYGIKKSVAEACSTAELTSRVLALTLHRRYTMKNHTDDTTAITVADEAVTKVSKKNKKNKKNKANKKNKTEKVKSEPKAAPKKKAAPSGDRSERINSPKAVGERTLVLLKKAHAEDGQREAGLLAKGKTISVASLTTLRAAVNTAKAKMNEKGNTAVAVDLNKMVRKVRTLLYDASSAKKSSTKATKAGVKKSKSKSHNNKK